MPFKTEEELSAAIMKNVEKEKAKGKEMFMGMPDCWYEPPHWRCKNDHVSRWYIKSEAKCDNICPACFSPIHLTFPEDKDGLLEEVSS